MINADKCFVHVYKQCTFYKFVMFITKSYMAAKQ